MVCEPLQRSMKPTSCTHRPELTISMAHHEIVNGPLPGI